MKVGIRPKIQILLIGFVLCLGLVAMGAFLALQNKVIHIRVARDAVRAKATLTSFVNRQSAEMVSQTTLIAELPTLKSAVIGSGDAETIRRRFEAYRKQLHAESFVITDDTGALITGDGLVAKTLSHPIQLAGVQAALRGDSWTGFISQPGKLYLGVTVPMMVGGDVKATISIYIAINSAVAKEMGLNLGADVVFMQNGKVVGTSIPGATEIKLHGPDLVELTSGNHRYVGLCGLIPGTKAVQKGEFVVLRRYEDMVAPYRETKFILLIVLGIVLLLSVPLSSTIARQLISNIDGLVAAARMVEGGKWPEPFDVKRSDEIGTLQLAFNEMTTSMQASQQRLISMMADIEKAQSALTESNERYAVSVEGSKDGLWDWQCASGEIYLSPQWKRILGYEDEELPNHFGTLQNLIHEDDLGRVLGAIDNYLAKNQTDFEIEYRMNHKDGTVRWILARAAALWGDDGHPIRMAGSHTDITPWKQAEAELIQARDAAEGANKAKSQFLANMSHELRTPLNAVLGFAELMADPAFGKLGPRRSEFVHHILASGQHLLSLINSVLDLAKVESGTLILHSEAVCVPMAIQEVVDVVKAIAQVKSIQLVVDCDDSLPRIDADPSKLRQILYNLASNAVKFSSPGTTTTLSAKSTEEGVEIAVRDEGIGIRAEDRERIFHEFEQIDGTYARMQQGTGLGLTLCQRLVDLHKGRIWVESAGENLGSTFKFVIPVWQPTAEEEVDTYPLVGSHLTGNTTFLKVLVIEDNAVNMTLASSVLQFLGHFALCATTAEEGLNLAVTDDPDVILMDLGLPGMNGLDATRWLSANALTSHIPVIALTAQAMVGDRERALNAGCVAYLTKPIDIALLKETLCRVTEQLRPAA